MSASLAEHGMHAHRFDAQSHLQARFNVSITAALDYVALSNTAEVSAVSVPAGGAALARTRHQYEQTPPMATYLVGINVGDLDKIEGVYKRGNGEEVPVRAWGRAGQMPSLRLALGVAVAALRSAQQLSCSRQEPGSQRL
jgi:aminopeptidase N